MSVRAGERRAVLGSNGAGKTTLFNAITGDVSPSSGTIRFFGEDITRFPLTSAPAGGSAHLSDLAPLRGLSVIDSIFLACRGRIADRYSLIGRAATTRPSSRRRAS